MEESLYIENALIKAGYFVKAITVEELSGDHVGNIHINRGFMLVVPSCKTLPIDIAPMLKRFMESAGGVLFTGGPLFYDLVKKNENNRFEKSAFEDTLDGNMASGKVFVREGIAPFYKTFAAKNIKHISLSPNQSIFNGKLSFAESVSDKTVSIPCETGVSSLFDNDTLCRFIPLAECSDLSESEKADADIFKLGRKNGNRGLFSFIELEKTYGCGHLGKSFFGSVESTAVGSAVASIGCHCKLLEIEGIENLIAAIAHSFNRGLYLFNAGADGLRYYKNECINIGGEIFNMADDFKKVLLKIRIKASGEELVFAQEKLVCPHSIAKISFGNVAEALRANGVFIGKESDIISELWFNGEKIDEIKSYFSFEKPEECHDATKYICADGDKFRLGNKHWYMAGMNYWNTYNTALEASNYWKGMFDKSNYDPKNIENDLEYIEKLGLNCLLTRVDFTDIDNVKHGVRDFLIRCEKHGLRVMLAITKATKTKYYCKEAVEEFFKQIPIANNPTVMALDIEWESVSDHYNQNIIGDFDDEWQDWIVSRYGSVEQAEKALKVKFVRSIYGYINCPGTTIECAKEFRAFSLDAVNKSWASLCKHLRPLVPHQMLTFRHGASHSKGKAQAVDYMDFTPLETYGIFGFDTNENPDRIQTCVGALVSCSIIQKNESGGKPVVWAEYGRSLCGVKWTKGSFAYDHENMKYLDERIEEQLLYNSHFLDAIEECGCAGSAPWWWCGGFRFSELADFGYMNPSGLLCESGIQYAKFCEKMKKKLENDVQPANEHLDEYILKGNPDNYFYGKETFIKEECVPAYINAKKLGKKLNIITTYDN